ncbi:MAG: ABC transporter permease, partial [Planctomycetota bacterium]
ISYKTAFVLEILWILAAVIAFYFIGEVFGGAVSPVLESYGNDYFAFLLIGVALLDYMSVSLKIFDTSIRESQMMGTLEIILSSPIRLSRMLVFSSLWAYIFTSFRFSLYMLFGFLLFDLEIGNGNFLGCFLVLILSILCFASFGIISASIVMVFKSADWFRVFLNSAAILLGGVVYPLSVLPDWVEPITVYIPMTHSLNGMRHALLQGYSLSQLLPEILFLILFAAVFIPLGLICFRLAVNRTKETGTLTHY